MYSRRQKAKSKTDAVKNITKQKPCYLLSISNECGDENIGSRYIKLNEKVYYLLTINLKSCIKEESICYLLSISKI